MSTFMKNPQDVERKWFIVDAADKPLGKVATQVATILMGKHRPDYTPHVDCGDCVVVTNASKVVLTGKKATDKFHRHHTGHIGGLKEVSYGELLASNPERLVKIAVKGMLPKNKIADAAMTRLRVSADENHAQQAQKPEVFVK